MLSAALDLTGEGKTGSNLGRGHTSRRKLLHLGVYRIAGRKPARSTVNECHPDNDSYGEPTFHTVFFRASGLLSGLLVIQELSRQVYAVPAWIAEDRIRHAKMTSHHTAESCRNDEPPPGRPAGPLPNWISGRPQWHGVHFSRDRHAQRPARRDQVSS